ncbi:hypothetical protein HPB50_019089 [Hyalomma asiaticum]|uniref:Uncharacterized protein n=1 Tax=Hyalomma asiaticum TaxID=266040 RepID=A0ACB7RJL9_HYAAI|nr:hypothetical protein HPB50_019089 [Hyalomma asiaticum]
MRQQLLKLAFLASGNVCAAALSVGGACLSLTARGGKWSTGFVVCCFSRRAEEGCAMRRTLPRPPGPLGGKLERRLGDSSRRQRRDRRERAVDTRRVSFGSLKGSMVETLVYQDQGPAHELAPLLNGSRESRADPYGEENEGLGVGERAQSFTRS